MNEITWDSVILALIVVGALAFLLRKFTLPTSRCGCGSSCGGCEGNIHRSRKNSLGREAEEGTCSCQSEADGANKQVNKCYMLDESAKRNKK